MSNRISERVADFLRRYPPFDALDDGDLQALALEVDIFYREKGSYVFREGEETHSSFYVVHKGAVDLRAAARDELVDICDEGDIFGLRPLMAGEKYQLEAQTREESLLYAIPLAEFRPLVQSYTAVGNFLLESFASNTRNPYTKAPSGKLFSGSRSDTPSSGSGLRYNEVLPVSPRKNVVSCSPDTPASEIASLMSSKKVGSVLVLYTGLPLGIITDKDLRNQVATGKFPISAPARSIMSAPVITYPPKLSLTQAQLAMMKNDISHLCLTEDGTPDSQVVGMLSKYDLVLAMGNNPEVLMRAIKRTRKIKRLRAIRAQIQELLRGYLQANIPMSIIMRLIAELNDACVKRIVQLAIKKAGEPPVPFAWMAMGSQGRGEQLLQTDQDNALVFADVPEERLPQASAYFQDLAGHITRNLKRIGYAYCPAEMMASSPDWCLSLSEWKHRVSQWIINPGKNEVLLSSIFFDYNLTYGTRDLVTELSSHIFESIRKYPIFFYHLAAGALQNPSPTGFFRQFLVEQDGKHKDFFDLKQRALMPLTDAARVLILSHEIKSINNTAERFEKLAELESNNRDLFLSCSYATKALLKFRARQGLQHGDNGRFIALDSLSKEEKIKLKRTFKTIKEVQELIAVRFKVSNLLV